MLKRSLTFVSILTTLTLALGVAVALAQELSDKEHLDKGIELFNNKKYAEALDHLKEVDASKLSRFDQDKPALYIQRAGEAQAKQQEALGLMQTGRLSLRNKQYAEALATFDKAHANTQYLGAADAKTLESLIILAKRGQEESGEQPVTAPAAEPAANWRSPTPRWCPPLAVSWTGSAENSHRHHSQRPLSYVTVTSHLHHITTSGSCSSYAFDHPCPAAPDTDPVRDSTAGGRGYGAAADAGGTVVGGGLRCARRKVDADCGRPAEVSGALGDARCADHHE